MPAQLYRLDRNERARLLFQAEALDRRTHLPGQHGGCLKRTGLAVLRALLFSFANVVTGRCDPSYDTLARAAGVARQRDERTRGQNPLRSSAPSGRLRVVRRSVPGAIAPRWKARHPGGLSSFLRLLDTNSPCVRARV